MKTYIRGEEYYYIDELFSIRMRKFVGAMRDYDLQRTYNCFEHRNAAEEAIIEFKDLLRQYNE